MTKDKIEFHIIHSVKGGSGKTAYSLFKALMLAQKVESSEAKVLYLDADFKGTALKNVIYAKDEEGFRSINSFAGFDKAIVDFDNLKMCEDDVFFAYGEKYQKKSLNDYLIGNVDSVDEILVNCGIYKCMLKSEEMSQTKAELRGLVDFIFSSSIAEEKECFQYIGENDDFPMLSIGQFKRRFERLLLQIYNYCMFSSEQKKGQYDYIIIDMPPGEDEYSRTLLKAIEKFSQKKHNPVILYSYFVSTNDIGHIYSEFEEFAHQISKKKKKFDGYDSYVMVFNELREDEFHNMDNYLKKLKEELENKEIMDVSNLYYIVSNFQPDYYEYCRGFDKLTFGYQEGSKEEKLYGER